MSVSLLSIVILTYNEVDTITDCLESIKNWSDDIILIDHSTDETVKIARNLIPKSKLQIVSDASQNDFSLLRNRGLMLARREWVLFLDADERVSNELRQEIDQAITLTSYAGYYLARRDFFLGKQLMHGETGNIHLLKLGKKNAGKWVRRVHEVWQINDQVGELNHPLEHRPHPTVAEFIARVNRWTTLDAQEFYRAGKRSAWWKIILYPKAKFIINYFIKLGLLDGMPGLIMALVMSFHSFLTRAKLYLLQTNKQAV